MTWGHMPFFDARQPRLTGLTTTHFSYPSLAVCLGVPRLQILGSLPLRSSSAPCAVLPSSNPLNFLVGSLSAPSDFDAPVWKILAENTGRNRTESTSVAMSESEEPLDAVEEGGDDLFGDEAGDEVASNPPRALADDELASELEEDTGARRLDSDDDDDAPSPQETRDKVVIEQPTYRHRVPKPTDGRVSYILSQHGTVLDVVLTPEQLRLLRVPTFIKIMPEVYDPDTYEPSEFDAANARSEQPKCVTRVQLDQSTGEMKSNTNIYRWSDGSITISVGGEHYEIQKKPLASGLNKPYDELQDAHCYAAAAELGSNLLMTVGHLTEQYTVKPNKTVGDDALSVFAERMAEASKAMKGEGMIVRTTKDPELQKEEAELAEKERNKAQRRRENAAARMDGSPVRFGRGNLSIGDLEGERRGVRAGRKREAFGVTNSKRRRPEYDSDDDLPQGVGRHENYDMDDGFLVASDDEEIESGADEDDEDDEEELLNRGKNGGRRFKKPKTVEVGDNEDAEGDEVESLADASGRARRRNVIDDDEDEN